MPGLGRGIGAFGAKRVETFAKMRSQRFEGVCIAGELMTAAEMLPLSRTMLAAVIRPPRECP
jgi:hypothetical protein